MNVRRIQDKKEYYTLEKVLHRVLYPRRTEMELKKKKKKKKRMGGFYVRAEGRVTWPANLGRVEERPYVVSGVRSAQCARQPLP